MLASDMLTRKRVIDEVQKLKMHIAKSKRILNKNELDSAFAENEKALGTSAHPINNTPFPSFSSFSLSPSPPSSSSFSFLRDVFGLHAHQHPLSLPFPLPPPSTFT